MSGSRFALLQLYVLLGGIAGLARVQRTACGARGLAVYPSRGATITSAVHEVAGSGVSADGDCHIGNYETAVTADAIRWPTVCQLRRGCSQAAGSWKSCARCLLG